MSDTFVCSMAEMPKHVAVLRPARLISLVTSAEQPPTPKGVSPTRHLRLEIDDITQPLEGSVAPSMEHVTELVDFLEEWNEDRPLLIHCVAGISRSTAAALVAMAMASPGRERDAAHCLRAAAPHAHPNRRIVALADELLARQGRLVASLNAIGLARPAIAGLLVRLPRYL